MSEKRILLAAVLKPVNDTRMYEKLGLSLSKLPDTQIHIAGFHAPLPTDAPSNLRFHPIFRFNRLSLTRFKAQQLYLNLLQQLQPHLIIACTHELLLPSMRYCQSTGAKLVYDVQENYSLNLTSQRNYLPVLRQLLAWSVRRAERRAAHAVSHFLLAERSYADELPFLEEARYSIIENKYKPAPGYTLPATPVRLQQVPLRLLYSGTIAEMNGVFEAVELAEKLHALDETVSLKIIGYSSRQDTLQRLKQRIKEKPYITLVGGDGLVPHQKILEAIGESSVGLLPYWPHPSTSRCIPTKLFEYIAYALPVLVQQNPLWASIVAANKAGLSVDFAAIQPQELLQRIRQQTFYTSGVPDTVYWKSEEAMLNSLIKELLN
ncbi:glycosyltransferase [Pontibacter akesuensis]|uniref:Glycosyltransferase involved in cell wall bisynthesis n=1 Tax=Pontibacter akesuensis TaxID=388950 RepID=A0A1I7FW35_9BACT|nr:glycosyltransferase [Pontibacter akesuensis]GHA60227.1 hypothetical protein GCM10007389_10570 [Pontibacter akesuensis]SFU40361.1 Glycosyltransferase involved in cell wall bisynthesis [Pontibacter akesuensis]